MNVALSKATWAVVDIVWARELPADACKEDCFGTIRRWANGDDAVEWLRKSASRQ